MRVYDQNIEELPRVQQRSVEELIDRNLVTHQRGIDDMLFRFRNSIIVRALMLNDGNVSQTAVMLQTARENLNRWMKEAGL